MKKITLFLLLIVSASAAFALEPNQILIIANADVSESVSLAEYYCIARAVPTANILKVPLGPNLPETISRADYDSILAKTVSQEIVNRGKGKIKCLLTLYGVPIKIGSAGPVKNSEIIVPKLTSLFNAKDSQLKNCLDKLSHLGRAEMVVDDFLKDKSLNDIIKALPESIKSARKRIEYVDGQKARNKEYNRLVDLLRSLYGAPAALKQAATLPKISWHISAADKKTINQNGLLLQIAEKQSWDTAKKLEMNFYPALESVGGLINVVSNLQTEIDTAKGSETAAAVDSELSMVLYGDYNLYRWQKNDLRDLPSWLPSRTVMVSRLDGPSYNIAKGLVDKALKAEKNGLKGKAYIDTRGLSAKANPSPQSYEYYDISLLNLAEYLTYKTSIETIVDKKSSLFAIGSCPDAALYCGWYSVRKYVDAFEFNTGAVGFHIASFEAADLRNPASTKWCTAMLKDGITATLGPVDEPYLGAFVEPYEFFSQLIEGKTLAEAFYYTNPYNSWQIILIGDPLYVVNLAE